MPNSLISTEELVSLAKRLRRLVLDTTHRAGMGHTGGSLSEADILVALYWRAMQNLNPAVPDRPDRDRFILSKGHASPGYYATLAMRGYFPLATLESFDELGTTLQAHPDMHKAAGVDMSTGSLGQGLSVGIGIASAAKRIPEMGCCKTFVLMGDGEMQEGQVWEAAMYAGSVSLPGIIAIVDCNGVQLSTATGGELAADRLAQNWKAFGWNTREASATGPVAVMAKTIKGKGVSFMEGKYEWHGKAPGDDEYQRAIKEIGA